MHKQQGVALAISMVLLVAMTIVVLATMGGTRLNEKIASNSQQKAISFEAAESAIGAVWGETGFRSAISQIPIAPFDNPAAIKPSGLAATLSGAFDQVKEGGTALTVDISAEVSLQYCGETLLPKGSSLNADESGRQLAGTILDVNGIASIAGSKAHSDHIQRGYIMSPKTGRLGNCATPGT